MKKNNKNDLVGQQAKHFEHSCTNKKCEKIVQSNAEKKDSSPIKKKQLMIENNMPQTKKHSIDFAQNSRCFRKLVCVMLVSLSAILFVFFLSCSFEKIEASNGSRNSYIIIDADTNRVLKGSNINQRLEMASTTKVMTALTALKFGKLDDVVKIDKSCVGIEGSSIYLREGETLTLKELLFGLMLRSGNDCAEAIAKSVGGTRQKFVELMNEVATKELGLKNTNFCNPHGLSEKNHFTSSYDLAVITSEALKNKDFAEIVATKKVAIGKDSKCKDGQSSQRLLINKNKLLYKNCYATGVKTGYTKSAGRCFVGSGEKDGVKVVTVVLNYGPMFEMADSFLNEVFNCYQKAEIKKAGEVVKTQKVLGCNNDVLQVGLNQSMFAMLNKFEGKKIVFSTELKQHIIAPVKKGEHIGTIKAYIDNVCIAEQKLFAQNDVKLDNYYYILKKVADNMSPF